MEQLNRIEIRGNVGNVSINTVGDTRVAHFSVATNYAYKTQNGEPVIDTTWHNVTAWEGNKGIPALDFISKGTPVYVCGRLRSHDAILGALRREKIRVPMTEGADREVGCYRDFRVI